MIPLYSERGGVRKGKSFLLSWNASWPFIKFEIFMDRVILSFLWFRTELHINDIDHFEIVGPKNFLGSVKIVHHKSSESSYILFYTWNPIKLLDKLKEFGFPVKN